MRNNLIALLTGIALATGMISASATGTSVTTLPAGLISYNLVHGTTNLLSLPLTNTETYTSTVSAVTSKTISVGDAPAPFTSNMATAGSPYFVKFTSGAEAGRILLITSNTSSVLTLDTTDHGMASPVTLTTSGYAVAAGDAFEIFPGDTLVSLFGAGTAQSPTILTGGSNVVTADTVTLFGVVNTPVVSYYFNTDDNCWEATGSNANANNTIVYPYSPFSVKLQATNSDATLIVEGRVTGVSVPTKMISNGSIYSSTHFATDVKLSQLQFGSNWVMGATALTADTLSVWNPTLNRFDTYYQKPDSTWRRFPDADTDQSNVTIAAGTVTAIGKRETVTGGGMFLQSPLPYSVD